MSPLIYNKKKQQHTVSNLMVDQDLYTEISRFNFDSN